MENLSQQQSKETECLLFLIKKIGIISRQKFDIEREYCLSACDNCQARSLAKAYTMPTDF